jgi:ABC-2 type transport system ATP-binding protein
VDQPQKAADTLKTDTERWRVSLFGDRLHVVTGDDVEREKQQTIDKLAQAGVEVRHVEEQTYSLEDVFIAVVEKARREGKVAVED